jgi:hypothetical protein
MKVMFIVVWVGMWNVWEGDCQPATYILCLVVVPPTLLGILVIGDWHARRFTPNGTLCKNMKRKMRIFANTTSLLWFSKKRNQFSQESQVSIHTWARMNFGPAFKRHWLLNPGLPNLFPSLRRHCHGLSKSTMSVKVSSRLVIQDQTIHTPRYKLCEEFQTFRLKLNQVWLGSMGIAGHNHFFIVHNYFIFLSCQKIEYTDKFNNKAWYFTMMIILVHKYEC